MLDVQAWHAGAVALFVLVGVFYPAIVTLLTYESNRQLGPTLTGAVSCTAPLFAVVTAVLFLDERLAAPAALGLPDLRENRGAGKRRRHQGGG